MVRLPSQKKGGGYYKDDGPGDDVPDLSTLVEPVPRLEPLHRGANRPYSVLGKDYQPFQSLRPYSATGVGSWYGRRYHGQKTSIGETYNMYEFTAAHPILPLPSYARVTNLENGRSVVVRVNDRGPFLADRLIDLSYAAAWKLGYVSQGSASVRVDTLIPGEEAVYAANESGVANQENDPIAALAKREEVPAAPLTTVATKADGVFLQLAAFSSRENAESFRSRIAADLPDKLLKVVPASGLFRVHLGPYASNQAASEAASRLSSQLNIKAFVVR